MPSDMPQFTVRIGPLLLKKFRYVAEYNARSANREAEMLIRRHVEDFEREHGAITPEDLEAVLPGRAAGPSLAKGKPLP